MKTVTLDAGGMFSTLDYLCVEKQLSRLPGVQRASASIASGSVTVEYDETATSVAVFKDKINECGFHCTGQIMPRHVCERPSGQTELAAHRPTERPRSRHPTPAIERLQR